MRVSVFGLGYVGCVTAACLAKQDIHVIGVDLNPVKVEQVNAGKSPVLEPGLEELIRDGVARNLLSATVDGRSAAVETDVSLICVGTPSNPNGSLDLDHVMAVCTEIGEALAQKADYHVVVIRSTVLPGTVEERLLPVLEARSGRRPGAVFGVCMNPEFLREGSAIDDYFNPSVVVLGELDARSGDAVAGLFAGLDAPLARTDLRTAELVKYASNAFHAVKVAFANEIGTIARRNDIDGRTVMEIFCLDTTLNISSAYLRPGFAFGGSCLPKDLRSLLYRASEQDVKVPLLQGAVESNGLHLQRGITLAEGRGRKRIGVLGLSFKSGTDDVRESPAVVMIETLIGRGHDVSIFDDDVQPERLIGANRVALERELPHIAALMRPTIEDVLGESDVVVVAKGRPDFRDIATRLRPDQLLVDLVGVPAPPADSGAGYEAICW